LLEASCCADAQGRLPNIRCAKPEDAENRDDGGAGDGVKGRLGSSGELHADEGFKLELNVADDGADAFQHPAAADKSVGCWRGKKGR